MQCILPSVSYKYALSLAVAAVIASGILGRSTTAAVDCVDYARPTPDLLSKVRGETPGGVLSPFSVRTLLIMCFVSCCMWSAKGGASWLTMACLWWCVQQLRV